MSADSSPETSAKTAIETIETPPVSMGGILLRLGPGLVIAGSIVGSGELIATTATGAEAGFWLLWLIVVGCLIKVFVQIEFGRYAIATGQGTMEGLEQVPGPRIRGRGNWLVWYWVLMFCASLAQLGGIVGGVGQALAISVPLTEAGRAYDAQMDLETRYRVARAELQLAEKNAAADNEASANKVTRLTSQIEDYGPRIIETRMEVIQDKLKSMPGEGSGDSVFEQAVLVINERREQHPYEPEKIFVSRGDYSDDEDPMAVAIDKQLATIGLRTANDHKYWAAIIAVITSIILVVGHYGVIQTFATFMVALFTLITIVNLVALQQYGEWAVTWQDLVNGLSFRLPPPPVDRQEAISTALFAFGIIGVGASELIAYPYWCLEKGYARFTGPIDKSDAWASRARGWLRVMRWDAWCSMVVYTFATIAFYLLGAAILGRIRLQPEGTEMIRTLSLMYAPVFGSFTQLLFLFGAFAVLYSTFFVANAGQARMCADAMQVTGLTTKKHEIYRRNVRRLSGLFPFICLTVYVLIPSPKELVLLSGAMQAMMLPMLSAAALYFRYRRCDSRIIPTRFWDVFLWVSAIGMLITGSWALYSVITKYFAG